MSHRVYIYNVEKIAEAQETDVMFVEWGYEVPLLLQPLFFGDAFITGNIYNTHTEPENYGLYFDAKSGLAEIKLFYNFIEQHQDELIDDVDAFLSAKEKLFTYLARLIHPYFHVDAWDVFNMSEEGHESQTEQLLVSIKQNNDAIKNAIENNDTSFLDFKHFNRDATLGFNSFKELLNYPDYNFGLGHIFDLDEEDSSQCNDVEIYEVNKLWGLKSANGEVLIMPFYDEFYGFEDGTLAVVSKAGKYGYINKKGKIVIPLLYDDAYDFEGGYAVIKQNEKYGLIFADGKIKLPAKYENLSPIGSPGSFYCAKLKGKFGVINLDDSLILPFDFDNEFEGDQWDKMYYVKENGRGAQWIYSDSFNFLGKFSTKFISPILDYSLQPIHYLVTNHKYQNTNLLLANTGEVLVDNFEKIIVTETNFLIIRKNKKLGLYHSKNGLILDFEYDEIVEITTILDVLPSIFFKNIQAEEELGRYYIYKIVKDNLCGLYFLIANFETWICDIKYQDFKALSKEFFAIQEQNKWGVIDLTGQEITKLEFDEIIPVISYSGIGYGFFGDDVYLIEKEGIELADKLHLEDYVEANGEHGYYYFSNEIQKKIEAYIAKN
ncbi:WG repeat-containing protein [Sphingobacterium sp. SRCM116780]|uniref:WG repeat-containing protein n=1 Tax=Sphingobacterium sp. SRCM116780 TaxID=2907623 RepID=UPI001F3E90CB|nr:WG repeat-containing protein [Sphingobacterium sp. SRCM116780]UIR54474.1 WG repeat-containing protein [Sphingobacterium sp. SRCM116780]